MSLKFVSMLVILAVSQIGVDAVLREEIVKLMTNLTIHELVTELCQLPLLSEPCTTNQDASPPEDSVHMTPEGPSIVHGQQYSQSTDATAPVSTTSGVTATPHIHAPTTAAYKPLDCQDVRSQGYKETGVYEIYPAGVHEGVEVRCDMDTSPGDGWTVFQRRISKSAFNKTWDEYLEGFGDLSTNFWLGNNYIAMITGQDKYELRVDLVDSSSKPAFAVYQGFLVDGPETKFKLSVSGYSGTAGDSLSRHNGMAFSTVDADNDVYGGNCAQMYLGGWWYDACHSSNLNGEYGSTAYGKGLNWRALGGYHSSMETTEMKVRRKNVQN